MADKPKVSGSNPVFKTKEKKESNTMFAKDFTLEWLMSVLKHEKLLGRPIFKLPYNLLYNSLRCFYCTVCVLQILVLQGHINGTRLS